MPTHPKTKAIKLEDEQAERVRQSHSDAIDKLQAMPSSSMEILTSVLLKNGVQTPVSHPLGRIPKWIGISAIRGAAAAGVIQEYRDGSVDRTKFVSLRAISFGADITVDIAIM